MATYTVTNQETGKKVKFQWNGAEPPTDTELDEIFAEAEGEQPTGVFPDIKSATAAEKGRVKGYQSILKTEEGQNLMSNGIGARTRQPINTEEQPVSNPETPMPATNQAQPQKAEGKVNNFVQPLATAGGGFYKAAGKTAELLGFYADKISKAIGVPETKESVFKTLANNWGSMGDTLKKKGLTEGLMQKVYEGLGQAGWDVPKMMAMSPFLKGATLAAQGAAEGYKEGGIKGAAGGAGQGALFHGALKGVKVLPTNARPVVGAAVFGATTPGDVSDKVAGAVLGGALSAGGSPVSNKEFKSMYSKPLTSINTTAGKQPTNVKSNLYDQLINRFAPLEKLEQRAQKEGAVVNPGESPTFRARGYLGIGGKVREFLSGKTFSTKQDGSVKVTGEGLQTILREYDKASPEKNNKVKLQDLSDYLIAQRTIKDLQRPKKKGGTEKIVTDAQVQKATATLDRIKTKYGNTAVMDGTSERLYAYQQRLLHLLVDSGNMSQKQYDKIVSDNPHYIPFYRVMDDMGLSNFTEGTPATKRRFTGAKAPINKIQGSERDITNPFESIVENAYRIMDRAERNTVAGNVAKLANFSEGEITFLDPKTAAGKQNIITYFVDGEKKVMQASPSLYNAMTGMDEKSSSFIFNAMSKPASWLRRGATMTPEFIMRNPIRDQWTAFMQARLGFKPFIDPVMAIADITKKTDAYHEWLASGGAYSGFVELSKPQLAETVKQLRGQAPKARKFNVVLGAEKASELMEQATRVAIFKASKKQGLSSVESGFAAREGTIDFSRRGSQTKDINSVIAFFNANIQGLDKTARTASQDPFGFTAKGLASLTIPSVLLYLHNRNDEMYKELPSWRRDLFWNFKVDENYWSIPKPFLYGQVFGTAPERFLEYIDKNDPKVLKDLTATLIGAASPLGGEQDPVAGILPTAFKPLMENATNYSFFQGNQMVPHHKTQMMAESQYSKYTGEFAKELSKTLAMMLPPDIAMKDFYAPAKIENMVRGYGGGTGAYLLQGADGVTRLFNHISGRENEGRRPIELKDIPVIKGFAARRPETYPQSLTDFYEDLNRVGKAYRTWKQLAEAGRGKDADRIAEKHGNFVASSEYNSYAKTFSELSDAIDEIAKSKEFTQKEKRALIMDLETQRLITVQTVNQVLNNLSVQ